MLSSVEINKPLSEVFVFLEDGHRTDSYIGKEFQIKPVLAHPSTDGRYRLGSQVLGAGSFSGVQVKLLYKVVVFEENKLVKLQSDDKKFDSQVTWKLHPTGEDTTKVSLEVILRQKSGLLTSITNTVMDIIEPVINRYLAKSLERLKHVLEHQAVKVA